ncbi:MAG TPA: TonB family protein [Polyangiaceae bacterium]
MSSPRRRSIAFYVYGGSLVLHAALAIGTVVMPAPRTSVATAITLVEEKKKKDPPKPAPAPPPPPKTEDKPKPRATPQPQPQQQQAKTAPEPKAEAPPPMPVDNGGFADLGVSLGNAEGPGLAVPGAAAATAPAAAKGPGAAAATTHKVQQLEAPTQGAAACTEPLVRPKRKVPVAPKYTMQARQAEIEGVVRVQVTVDESGRVIQARVVSGLGYGLDESALAAAKATTFEPATQCGKPVVGTTVLPFRFEET